MERHHTIGAIVLILGVFLIVHVAMSTMTQAVFVNESPAQDGLRGEDAPSPDDAVEITDIPPGRFPDIRPAEPAGTPTPVCADECHPLGNVCSKDTLKSCGNFDDDACTEYLETVCTFGCGDSACLTAPKDQPKSQDEIRRTPHIDVSQDQECVGEPIGVVQWNPHGSLCRKSDFDSANRGFMTPMHCCRRYFSQTSCTANLGPIEDQLQTLPLKYYEIECWT